MDNYKEMYLKLFNTCEDAISSLIEAQRECEEMYISSPEIDEPENDSEI